MKVKLSKIREYDPCTESWTKLLKHLGKSEADESEVELKLILDLLGIYDAIWALRALENKDKEIRLFACDYAESVLHIFEKQYPDDNRPRKCIEVSRRYANGEASDEERDAAWAAAWDARAAAWDARDAAWAAAWAAALDVRAAWAAWAAEKQKQVELYIKHFCS